MANKRMFTKDITDDDPFLDMPISAQGLYFQLAMAADDDGFVGNPKKVTRMVGASESDYNRLIEKRFILTIGHLAIIKHWRMHNTISRNRYHETRYTDEKAQLLLKDDGSYSFTSGNPIDDSRLVKQEEEEARKRRARGAQTAHEKPKKSAPKKPTVYYPNDVALDKAFCDYVEMRKKIKKPMTDRAVEMVMNKLQSLSGGNADVAVAILEQSVLNSWQGLFPLKGEQRQGQQKTDWDNV